MRHRWLAGANHATNAAARFGSTAPERSVPAWFSNRGHRVAAAGCLPAPLPCFASPWPSGWLAGCRCCSPRSACCCCAASRHTPSAAAAGSLCIQSCRRRWALLCTVPAMHAALCRAMLGVCVLFQLCWAGGGLACCCAPPTQGAPQACHAPALLLPPCPPNSPPNPPPHPPGPPAAHWRGEAVAGRAFCD